MIGFIGPEDATSVASAVAATMGITDVFIIRTYASSEDAAVLTEELDQICEVVVFAGRWPYHQALASGHKFRAQLQFVPEGPEDLYQVIVGLLRENDGVMPRISLDTMDSELAAEVFKEVDLDAPKAVLPIDDITGDWGEITRRLVEFHLEKIESGQVDIAVTWLRSAYDHLVAKGVPAWRAKHTTATYREALTRASLAFEAKRSKASQVVVGRMVATATYGRAGDRLKVGEISGSAKVVESYAKELRGSVSPSADGHGWLIYTTRGALNNALARHHSGVDSPFLIDGRVPGILAFGVGPSMVEAITCAERALTAAASSDQICVMHSSGLLYSVDALGAERVISLRAFSGDHQAKPGSGLGPLSTSRLLDSMRLLDTTAITAPQLASAYGVTERSARRLLKRLEVVGAATQLGREGAPGPGRPRVIYQVDIDRLTESTLQRLDEPDAL